MGTRGSGSRRHDKLASVALVQRRLQRGKPDALLETDVGLQPLSQNARVARPGAAREGLDHRLHGGVIPARGLRLCGQFRRCGRGTGARVPVPRQRSGAPTALASRHAVGKSPRSPRPPLRPRPGRRCSGGAPAPAPGGAPGRVPASPRAVSSVVGFYSGRPPGARAAALASSCVALARGMGVDRGNPPIGSSSTRDRGIPTLQERQGREEHRSTNRR